MSYMPMLYIIIYALASYISCDDFKCFDKESIESYSPFQYAFFMVCMFIFWPIAKIVWESGDFYYCFCQILEEAKDEIKEKERIKK